MISKVLSLSRPAMLNNIFSLDQSLVRQTSLGVREFFDVGLPMFEPLSPAGTMVITLERSFLYRNAQAFLWASIPDNGGVRYGFLPHIEKHFYKSIRLDYPQFLKVLEKIDRLPVKCIEDVLSKKVSENFCNAVRSLISDEVVDGMLTEAPQAARRIEFCLDGALRLCDSDLRSVFVPNTYKHILCRYSAKVEPSKIVYYNPKYTVIEKMRQYGFSCNWRS